MARKPEADGAPATLHALPTPRFLSAPRPTSGVAYGQVSEGQTEPQSDAAHIKSSPKMSAQISAHGYRYYAGFSADFVDEALTFLGVSETDVVLDPWNGSGTTTLVAGRRGVSSLGVDLNPAMKVVALGRLLRAGKDEVIGSAHHACKTPPPSLYSAVADPLRSWFAPRSAARIRILTQRVAGSSTVTVDADQVTALQAHLLTGLFLTVRSFLKPALTSNPTWVRRSLPSDDLIDVSWPELTREFLEVVGDLKIEDVEVRQTPRLTVGNATNLTGVSESATVIFGSPPYCTRLDYVAATRPELAILGWGLSAQEELRRSMLGTTTVEAEAAMTLGRSQAADDLVRRITTHLSRASATYYRKWITQYFDGYWDALTSIDRACKNVTTVALVVQDSYYKEHHIDLARITQEYAGSLGWVHQQTLDFVVPRTMASINSRIRPYRDTFRATESMLIFKTTPKPASSSATI